MSQFVKDCDQLAEFAKRLSKRHDEECTCFDEPFVLDECGCETSKPVIKMDVRERKWVAQKLLRPIENDADCVDFTFDDWLAVAREHWRLRFAGPEPQESILLRFRASTLQLRYTKAFVRAVWGLEGAGEAQVEAAAGETGFIDIDDDLDDDLFDPDDYFDWSEADIDVKYSSSPGDKAPHEIGKDFAGNKMKIY